MTGGQCDMKREITVRDQWGISDPEGFLKSQGIIVLNMNIEGKGK